MPNEYQTTSKSLSNRFLTKAERELFGLLEGGPREYSSIWKYLKEKGISRQTSNRLLKRNVESKRLFRIEKGKNVFYRVNDFPVNVNTLLLFVDSAIKERESRLEVYREEQNGFRLFKKEKGMMQADQAAIEKMVEIAFEIHLDSQALRELQILRRNIVSLYPKQDVLQIGQLTAAEISASTSGNQSLLDFLERFKAVLV